MLRSLFRTWKFIAAHPLASRNKTRAIGRWARWQIGSRLIGSPVVMPFIEDSVLVVEPGMEGATGNIYCGLHEFADMAFVLHVLRPDDLFVDVGANIGSFSVLAAKVAGASGVAMEPVPETFTRLQRNLRMNDLGSRVQALQCAAGSGTATLCFSTDKDATNRVVDESYPGKKVNVPVQSLDSVLGQQPVFAMKVDVEGFEHEVLAGAKQTLQCPTLRAVLLEGDDPEIAAVMKNAGFVCGGYDPFKHEILLGEAAGTNYNHLWFRDLEFVRKRCREARKIPVLGIQI